MVGQWDCRSASQRLCDRLLKGRGDRESLVVSDVPPELSTRDPVSMNTDQQIGDLRELEARFLAAPTLELAKEMIDLRIQGGPQATGGKINWTEQHDNRFGEVTGLPEIAAAELSVEALRAGILGKGGLIVRNVMNEQTVAHFRGCIEKSLSSPVRLGHSQPGLEQGDAWFRRSPKVEGGAQGPARVRGGDLSATAGSVWAVDAPRTAADLIAFYQRMSLDTLLTEYFNEPALLSVRKWVLRCVPPMKGGNKGWHQDGRFMGEGIRTVNLWIALSDCGEGMPAPGLELHADNRRVIHETGTQGAFFDWTVGPELVAELEREAPIVCPTFRAGDAIFFDHFSLHRTGEGPEDSQSRYAVESWFFAASTAPAKQQPLLF